MHPGEGLTGARDRQGSRAKGVGEGQDGRLGEFDDREPMAEWAQGEDRRRRSEEQDDDLYPALRSQERRYLGPDR